MSSEALKVLGQSLYKLSTKKFADELAKAIDPSTKSDLGKTFRRKLLDYEVHYLTKRAVIEFYDEFIKHNNIEYSTKEFNDDIELLWNKLLTIGRSNYYIKDDKIYLIELNKLANADREAILNFIFQEPVGSVILSEDRYKKLKQISAGFKGVSKLLKGTFTTLSIPEDSILLDFISEGYDVGHYGANITHLSGVFTIGALLSAGKENSKVLNEFMSDPQSKKLVEQEYRDILQSEGGKALFKAELFKIMYEHELELIRQVSDDKAYSKLNLKFNAGTANIKTIVKNVILSLKSSGVEVGPQNSALNRSIGGEIESMIRSHLPRFYKAIESAIAYRVSTGELDLAKQQGSDSLDDLIHKKFRTELVKGKSKNISITSKTNIKAQEISNIKVTAPTIKNSGSRTTKKDTKPRLRTTTGRFTSLVNIEKLIKASLQETVIKNMQRPNLRNQTGRFAKSVELVKVSQRGKAIQAFLTYMKYPYQTFEPGFKQGHKGYDPRRLIDQSVREIATKLVKARLQTVFV